MKAVEVILHTYVESRRDRALFFVPPDMQVAIGATISQPVDQPGVSVKAKNDGLVFGEEGIVIRVAQSVRVFRSETATSSDRRH